MEEDVYSMALKGYNDGHSIPLPLEKLSFPRPEDETRNLVVLVETGSFNPPTYMHLNMFESGKEALVMHGYHVVGGYMSPVNSAYGKKELIFGEHRIKMCQLAVEGSSFIMVDPWEASQPTYQRTLKVLVRVADALRDVFTSFGPIRVMLLCGADLLESFTVPGVWLPDQVETICRDHGLVCLQRGGRDVRKLIGECELLSKYNENIVIADNFESDISSTRVRENLAKGLPVDSLTPASVAPYCASKWAIEGLTQAVAKEVPQGVTVVALNPGIVNTDMLVACFGSQAALYQSPDTWAPLAADAILNMTAGDNGASLNV